MVLKVLEPIKPKVKEIFSKGNLGLLDEGRIRLAIVGSRKMSDYGRRVIEAFVPELVRRGVIIVSGMMYGVDETAMTVATLENGQTIGVAGWGLDWNKDENINKLYKKVIQANGLVISEYKGATAPKLFMFPARNRIVAGISAAVLIIEAGEKSGSMVTARLAQKYHKPLLVVPGPIFSSVSKGTNKLISEGAIVIDSLNTLLRQLDLEGQTKGETFVPKSRVELALESGPKMLDELARLLNIEVNILSRELTQLEMSGVVKVRAGRYYI